jgi:hypothetical protein
VNRFPAALIRINWTDLPTKPSNVSTDRPLEGAPFVAAEVGTISDLPQSMWNRIRSTTAKYSVGVAVVDLCGISTTSLSKIIERSNDGFEPCRASDHFTRLGGRFRGIETVNMIRKGQIRWLPKDDILGQSAFITSLFAVALVA